MNAMNELGRNKLEWKKELWDRIDQAVHSEARRTKVAAKFLPPYGPLPQDKVTTVPADVIDAQTMRIDDSAVTPIMEISVKFELTKQQYQDEANLGTAVTLGTRAANLISQAEDLL